MNRSVIIGIIVAVVVIGGIAYWYSTQNQSYTPPAATQTTQPTPTAPSTATVTYTDSGFSPSSVTISKGGTVIFKNTASDDVWVASNPHPIHTGYPTTGGCVGSTFDSCKNITPGSSWSFTFDFVGSWGYHNHLNPVEGGTVIVQ